MTYGRLTAIVGPMGASKTTSILKIILWARNGLKQDVRVFKPNIDTRYSDRNIVSHDGLSADSESVDVLPDDVSDADLIVIDEVQFFPTSTIQWVRDRLLEGKDVVVAGLDMDSDGYPFPVTASLLGMATETVKQKANCTVCGRPASFTKRLSDSKETILIDGVGSTYQARCENHWRNDD